MQDCQKLQSMILEYLKNLTEDMSLITSTQVVKGINKQKKIEKQQQSKQKDKSKIQKQTIHYMCIKCHILYVNLQDAKIHQEVEHPDKNTYIKNKILQREQKILKKQSQKNKLNVQEDESQSSDEQNIQSQEKIDKFDEVIQSENEIFMGEDQ
ncbi:hypothetical protein pb186bvf_016134 [Paramecium bursaria]